MLSRETVRLQMPTGKEPFHVWTCFYRNGSDYLLRFPDLADFEVSSNGHTVRCWPVPGISEYTVQHLYLNQVLPLVLGKQGKLVFHASAIEIGSAALVFMGISGRGKSTLAASFATNGFRFLTDDGLTVEEENSRYQVQPSHPSIRLWQDSQEALVADDVPIAPSVQHTSKARFLAGGDMAFCGGARPLQRLYFLGEGTASAVEFQPMGPSEALIELVRHSFLLDIEEPAMLARHFDRLARLVSEPVFYRLDYPRRYEDLALVRQAIIEHATEESEVA